MRRGRIGMPCSFFAGSRNVFDQSPSKLTLSFSSLLGHSLQTRISGQQVRRRCRVRGSQEGAGCVRRGGGEFVLNVDCRFALFLSFATSTSTSSLSQHSHLSSSSTPLSLSKSFEQSARVRSRKPSITTCRGFRGR